MKRKNWLLAAMLCFLAAIGFWFVPDANPMLGFYASMITDTYSFARNPADQLTESDGWTALNNIQAEVTNASGATSLSLKRAADLETRLNYLELNVVTDANRYHPPEYSDDESLDPFVAACWNAGVALKAKLDLYYTAEQLRQYQQLVDAIYQKHPMHLEARLSPERRAVGVHRINASGLWLVLGVILLVARRGLLFCWSFEALFGRRMVRFAPLSAILAFALTGSVAVAQQLLNQYKRDDRQTNEQPLDADGVDPDAAPGRANTPLDSAPVEVHTEAWHYTDNRNTQQFLGVSLNLSRYWALTFIDQNLQTENGKSATSNFAFGSRFKLWPGVAVTVATGPQFQLKGPLSGKADQIVSYGIVTAHRPSFDVVSLNKLFTTVQGNTSPFHRHVLMIRAGPMPKWLYLMWEYKRSLGATKDDFRGIQVNGKIFGNGEQWWRKALRGLYVYGYHDSVRGDWFLTSGYAADFSFR